MYSLRKLVWAAYIVVGGLLAFIILLGLRQYVLAGQYNTIIEQSERAIFHFATIRESVTESLIDDNWQRLEGAIPEIEKLNSELVRLQENTLIPTEFKLAMVDKVDLAGIIIAVRKLVNGEGNVNQSKSLQEQMRAIADHLLQYDRIIGSQARGRILDFQMVVIGALGLIISLASFSLNKLYKNTVLPLLVISNQLQNTGQLQDEMTVGPDISREVADLIEQIQHLSARVADGSGKKEKEGQELQVQHTLIAEKVNETANQLNGIINYAQIMVDDDSKNLSEEERKMLEKIIESGVTIAKTWQTLR